MHRRPGVKIEEKEEAEKIITIAQPPLFVGGSILILSFGARSSIHKKKDNNSIGSYVENNPAVEEEEEKGGGGRWE